MASFAFGSPRVISVFSLTVFGPVGCGLPALASCCFMADSSFFRVFISCFCSDSCCRISSWGHVWVAAGLYCCGLLQEIIKGIEQAKTRVVLSFDTLIGGL